MSFGFERDPQAEPSRLQPPVDAARNDFIDSLRKRHPIYSGLLSCLERIAKASPLIGWGTAVGGLLVQRMLGRVADEGAGSPVAALLYGLVLFCAVTTMLFWLARPLLNSLLRLHSAGRRVVSANEVRESNWTVAYLAGALGCLAISFVPGWELLQIPALCLVLSTLPLQLVFRASAAPTRTAAVAVVAALGILTVMWPAAVRVGEPDLERQFIVWFWALFIGAIVLGPLVPRGRAQP